MTALQVRVLPELQGARSPVEVRVEARPTDVLGPGWRVVCSSTGGASSEWGVEGEGFVQVLEVPDGAVLTCTLYEPAPFGETPPISSRASLDVQGPGALVLTAGPPLETVVCVESPGADLTFSWRLGPGTVLDEGPPCWRVQSQHPQVLAVVDSPHLPCTRTLVVPRGGAWHVALEPEEATCPAPRDPLDVRVSCAETCPFHLQGQRCTLDGPEPCPGGVCWSGQCTRNESELRTLWLSSDEGLKWHTFPARDTSVEIDWAAGGTDFVANWGFPSECSWRLFSQPVHSRQRPQGLLSAPCPPDGEIRFRVDGAINATLWLQVKGLYRDGTTAVGWVPLPRDAPARGEVELGSVPPVPAYRGRVLEQSPGWPPNGVGRWVIADLDHVLETDGDGLLQLFAAPYLEGQTVRVDFAGTRGEFTVGEEFVLIPDDGPALAADGIRVERLGQGR